MPMMQDKQEKQASLIKLQDLKLFTARASKVKLVNLFDFGSLGLEQTRTISIRLREVHVKMSIKENLDHFFREEQERKTNWTNLFFFFFLFAAKSDFPFTLDRKKLFERDREEKKI